MVVDHDAVVDLQAGRGDQLDAGRDADADHDNIRGLDLALFKTTCSTTSLPRPEPDNPSATASASQPVPPGASSAKKQPAPPAGWLIPTTGATQSSRSSHGHGYEPRIGDRGEIELANCPFHRLAEEHRTLICGMNLDFLAGLLEGMDPTARPQARLAPEQLLLRRDQHTLTAARALLSPDQHTLIRQLTITVSRSPPLVDERLIGSGTPDLPEGLGSPRHAL